MFVLPAGVMQQVLTFIRLAGVKRTAELSPLLQVMQLSDITVGTVIRRTNKLSKKSKINSDYKHYYATFPEVLESGTSDVLVEAH